MIIFCMDYKEIVEKKLAESKKEFAKNKFEGQKLLQQRNIINQKMRDIYQKGLNLMAKISVFTEELK